MHTEKHVFANISGNLTTKLPLSFVVPYVLITAECAVGSLLALILLVLIASQRNMRTKVGILIAHLQFTELLLLGIFIPIDQAQQLVLKYGGPPVAINCREEFFWFGLRGSAGSWTCFAIAVNRFVAIVFPRRYSTMNTRYYLAASISLSWIMALACELPSYYGLSGVYGTTTDGTCGPVKYKNLPMYVASQIWGRHLPTALVYVIYFAIYVKINRMRRNQLAPAGAVAKGRTRRHLFSTVRMLLTAHTWYCICFIPPLVVAQFFPSYWSYYGAWLKICLLSGYAANPVSDFSTCAKCYRNVQEEPQWTDKTHGAPFKILLECTAARFYCEGKSPVTLLHGKSVVNMEVCLVG